MCSKTTTHIHWQIIRYSVSTHFEILLTNGQDGSEYSRIFHSGTIPLMIPELKLTFRDSISGTSTHMHHVIRVQHTKFLLSTG